MVLVDDNFCFIDEEKRYERGNFEGLESAVAAGEQVVDEFLTMSFKQGMFAENLGQGYKNAATLLAITTAAVDTSISTQRRCVLGESLWAPSQ